MEGGIFYAATDSAVPCAMMMNMAHVLGMFSIIWQPCDRHAIISFS